MGNLLFPPSPDFLPPTFYMQTDGMAMRDVVAVVVVLDWEMFGDRDTQMVLGIP